MKVKHTEAELRAAKDELHKSVAETARRAGVEPPTEDHARRWFEGMHIMERLALDENATSATREAPLRPRDRPGVVEGEVGAEVRVRGDSVDVTLTDAGRAGMHRPATGHLPAIRRTLRIVAAIRHVPGWAAWRTLMDEAVTKPLPPGHYGHPCRGCAGRPGPCKIREAALTEIIAQAFRAKGDPLVDEEARAILSQRQPSPSCPVDAADCLFRWRPPTVRGAA